MPPAARTPVRKDRPDVHHEPRNTPVVFCGPGIPRGKRSEAFAYQFDIYPTVCELLDIRPPGAIDGLSLAPIIRGKATSVRSAVYLSDLPWGRWLTGNAQWRLFFMDTPRGRSYRLHNLQSDPLERTNLAADPAYAAKIKELMVPVAEEQKRMAGALPPAFMPPQDGPPRGPQPPPAAPATQ